MACQSLLVPYCGCDILINRLKKSFAGQHWKTAVSGEILQSHFWLLRNPIRMFWLITLSLHQLTKLDFFHQLIKIQDNESKHASSNSQQQWRQDVNFSTHIDAGRQTRNEPAWLPRMRGKVDFIKDRGNNYHIHLKKRNKKLITDQTIEWIANNFNKKRLIAPNELMENTIGGKKIKITQKVTMQKFERIPGKRKFQMLCTSSWINKCTSECFWWQLYLSLKFQEFSTTVLHSVGLLSDYGILSFTNKSMWLNTTSCYQIYICIFNSIRHSLGRYLIFGMHCLVY